MRVLATIMDFQSHLYFFRFLSVFTKKSTFFVRVSVVFKMPSIFSAIRDFRFDDTVDGISHGVQGNIELVLD